MAIPRNAKIIPNISNLSIFSFKKKNPTIIANTGAVFPKIDVKEPEIVFNDRNQRRLEKVINDPAIIIFVISFLSFVPSIFWLII